ncbi:MAG TPA: hypothetical protein PL046_25125, partial [Polyangiaceae bacterium]|nr:hypothetical protein [Polyangiaceae bacterium]
DGGPVLGGRAGDGGTKTSAGDGGPVLGERAGDGGPTVWGKGRGGWGDGNMGRGWEATMC